MTGAVVHAAIRFAYDGTRFQAYARNPDLDTVEGRLVDALRAEGLLEDGFRTGSRTDAGVSALENVCKATLDRPHVLGLVPSLNERLRDHVWVTGATRVDERWNPRFAAWRRYRYAAPDTGEDVAAMNGAAAAFLGEHDFTAFAKLEDGRSPRRTVQSFTVEQDPRAGLWLFRVQAPNFLWHQIRRMVSAVVTVGQGKAVVEDITTALATREASKKFKRMPAEGLLLEAVHYEGLRWDQTAGELARSAMTRSYLAANAHEELLRRLWRA